MNTPVIANSSTQPETAPQTSLAKLELLAPNFFASDLARLPQVEYGTIRQPVADLVEFAQSDPQYPTANPDFGRFCFCSASESAADTRALLRLGRAALDFIEADFLACEEGELNYWNEQISKVEAMRAGRVLSSVKSQSDNSLTEPKSEAIREAAFKWDGDETSDEIHDESHANSPTRFDADLTIMNKGNCPGKMFLAAQELVNVIQTATYQDWRDCGMAHEIEAQRAAIRLIRRAVEELALTAEWNGAKTVAWHERELKGIQNNQPVA